MQVTWHSFDLRSGRRGPQLQTETQGTVKRALCQATDLSNHRVRIWQDDAPVPGWQEATLPGRTMLVALTTDTEDPVWGGMVLRRRGDPSEWVSLDLVTLEAYFDRRYTGDRTFTATAQTLIAEGLVEDTVTNGIEFLVDAQPNLALVDRTYAEEDDKTVLSALQELADVEGGIEYTVDLTWPEDDVTHTRLQPVLRLASHIGTANPTPAAQFQLPGSVSDFEYLEDYSGDAGANMVQANATAAGSEEGRLESQWWTAIGYGWAVFERKYSPTTAVADKDTLDAHARETLQQTWDGLTELTLTAAIDDAPKLGLDWNLGDDVGISLTCPRFPAVVDADGQTVAGYQAVARATAWELDLDGHTVRPTITETVPVTPEAA